MRLLAAIHRWLGALAAVLVLVIAGSGALLLFADDYYRWRLPELRGQATDPAISATAIATVAKAVGTGGGTIAMPTTTLPAFIRYLPDGGRALHAADDGHLIAEWTVWQSLPGFAFDAHAHLLAGEPGHWLVGVVGASLILMLLSGLWLWWPRRRQLALRQWLPRRSTSAALLRSHVAQGVLISLGIAFMGFSGIALVFDGAAQSSLNALFGKHGPDRPDPIRISTIGPSTPIDWAKTLNSTKAAFPEAALRMIRLPSAPGQPLQLRLRQPQELHPNGRTYLLLDPRNGRTLQRIDATRLGLGPQLYNSLYPLHAGKTGWTGHRLSLLVIAVVLSWVSFSGLWLFVRRQRRRIANAEKRRAIAPVPVAYRSFWYRGVPMPTDTTYAAIQQGLTDWQREAEESMRATGSGAVPGPSSGIPEHVRAFLDQKLSQAQSLYWVGEYFAQAQQMAKYPPGFESPHPAFLAYRGPGIAAQDHVQSHLFDFQCPQCGSSEQVVVLASEWGVSIQNGDARGTFSAKCSRCRRAFSGGFED